MIPDSGAWPNYADLYQEIKSELVNQESKSSKSDQELQVSLALIDYYLGNLNKAKDRSKNILNTITSKDIVAHTYYILGQIEYTHSNWDHANDCIRNGLQALPSDKIKSLLFALRAQVEYRLGNYSLSIKDSNNVIEANNNNEAMGIALSTLGIINHANKKDDIAVQMLKKSRDLSITDSNSALFVRVQNNLGTIFYDSQQYNEAKSHFQSAIDIAIQSSYKVYLGFPLLNLAGTLLTVGDYKQCRIILTQAEQSFTQVSNELMIGCVFMEKARLSRIQNKPKQVKDNLDLALKYIRKAKSNRFLSFIYKEFGLLARDQGDYRQAHYNLSMAREFAYVIDDLTLVSEIDGYLTGLKLESETN